MFLLPELGQDFCYFGVQGAGVGVQLINHQTHIKTFLTSVLPLIEAFVDESRVLCMHYMEGKHLYLL